MAPAVADPPLRKKAPKRPTTPKPWWGEGAAPHLQWPGVSLEFAAEWHEVRKRWESPDGRYYFDALEADRACDFFPEFLSHHIGAFAGQPFELLDYQKKLLIRPLFGWKQSVDGLRRFRKVFAFIPKGSGKSPVASGIGLYLLFCDNEPAAEIYAVASDRNQARIVHDNAKIMVEESPELHSMSEVLRDSIYYHAQRSVYQVLSADAASAHGKRPHGLIFDEFHAQRDRDLYEALKKSMPKRRQPVLIMITHAGDNDEGIAFEEYEYAKDILNGRKVDDTCLPTIFEAQNGDDWTDQALWKRVNPGHGVTIQHEGIVNECREAQNEPRKLNDFLRYHLNRWTNQASAWIPIDWWDACEPDPIPNYAAWLESQRPELATLPCAAGLDLAQKIDLACFSVVFRQRIQSAEDMKVEVVDEADGRVVKKMVSLNYRITVVPFFWIPEDTMREHEKTDGVPYSHWRDAGLIIPTEGVNIDYDRIYRDITEKILPMFPKLKQGFIGYDPAFATDIANELKNRAGLKVEEILQNYKYMSEACYIAEALIKAKHVSHGGHRVLRNHWENVSVKTDDARRIRPVKPKKASKHIDGVVATLMGLRTIAKVPDYKNPVRMFFMGGQHASPP